MRLLQPSSNIQLSKKNPDRFLKKACEVIRKGWGQPSVFNADMVVAELVRQGKTVEDARCGGTSGCVEAGAFGKESYILTGYFNLPKVVEITLNDGFDPRTGRQIGPKTGDPAAFTTFEQFLEAFRAQLRHFIDVKIAGSHIIERMYATLMPAPFLSLITDDCIAERPRLQRGRRALQHALHHAGRTGHHRRQPVGHQVPRLRQRPRHDAGAREGRARRLHRPRIAAAAAPQQDAEVRERRRVRRRVRDAAVRRPVQR